MSVARPALEALYAEAYSQGLVTSAEVQRLLGLSSRFEVARFLAQAGVSTAYDESDLEADRRTWDELREA